MDFILTDGMPAKGFVPIHKGCSTKWLSIDEQAVVFEAKSFERIDFVFFRRFSDKRSSQVAAYVVDNSNGKLDKKALSQLHRVVWLQGVAPLLYVSGASHIDILACARKPDFWNKQKEKYEYKPANTITLDIPTTAGQISDEMKNFSALRLADGTFWDDPDNKKLAKYDKAAHFSLIQAVVEADKELDGGNNPFMRRLLLLMILIKYLEDRKVFPNPGWFGRYHKGAKSFFDVLKGGDPAEVRRLLGFLADKFNGDIFDIAKFNTRELSKKSLKTFADLVEARTRSRQRYLWDQYSFEHLPVEIISHLYQRFIKDGVGAVYTPPFLAALLLDHAMPYNKMTGTERILDPACGSGVFLVGAFKRLINFWKSKRNWKSLSVEELKEKLKENIYGIDLDSNAIDLTAFSLSLAICDALKPKVIWNKLKFDCLRKANLIKSDFFELLLESRNNISNVLDGKFDIIVGNPPFESKFTEAAAVIDKAAEKKDASRSKCPDNQIAYLFFEQAFSYLRPRVGRICMIQPAGLFYNNNPQSFRIALFKKRKIDTVLDFVSIRKLYEADPKTVAVFAFKGNPEIDHKIEHWTFRRTLSTKERICFELDHYDRHSVSQFQAETMPYIWRVNLLNGGRLVDLSRRLRSMRTLSRYIEDKGWDYGEGFIVASGDKPAKFLTGCDFLPPRGLTQNGIDQTTIEIVEEKLFESPRSKIRFTAPLILIRELDSFNIDFVSKGKLAYGNEVVGIHAPVSEEKKLKKLFTYLSENRNLLRFALTLNGSRAFNSKATAVYKTDIDMLPVPEKETIGLSFWEKALQEDVVNYMAKYTRLGQESELLHNNAGKEDICRYSKMFIKMLGSIYDSLKSSSPIFLNGLICQPFYFGDKPELSWLNRDAEKKIKKLIYSKHYDSLRTVRVVRFYDKNVLLIIKPDRLRYWIRSTAIQDADETLDYLCRQGY